MSQSRTIPEHLDVLVVGAGLTGIGVSRYLKRELPRKSFTVLEARAASGGTWDLFRYPGIRSDSDLQTYGYGFKPWLEDESIAAGAKILRYLREVIEENGLEEHIRYQHRVIRAAWSSTTARWTVDVERGDTGNVEQITANWLFSAAGYFRHDEGYTPNFEGQAKYSGQVVHPQHWPEDLEYAGKRVLVIGSGATAITLIPSMVDQAAHVTMLQRTPSYVLAGPREDRIANFLIKRLGSQRGYALARLKNIALAQVIWKLCRKFPKSAKRVLRSATIKNLPAGYPVDEHFNPPYNPQDQRVCVAPEADLFKAISSGEASVVTGKIKSFTECGVVLESGQEIEADLIITATGLNVSFFGSMALTVDGNPVDVGHTVAYKAMMLSDVPNFAYVVGYTNLSYTLKIDLIAEHFCRLLAHMDREDLDICRPVVDKNGMTLRPFVNLGSGYIQRSINQLPMQGDRAPWINPTSYHGDVKTLRRGPVTDPELQLSRSGTQESRGIRSMASPTSLTSSASTGAKD